jgi:hypothetical protein
VWAIKDQDEEHLIHVNGLESGRRDTAALGSLVNESNIVTYLLDLKNRGFRRVRHEYHEVMGDDSIMFFKITSSFTSNDLNTVIQRFVDVSKDNGLSVNFIKSLASRYDYEFLKIRVLAGRYIPLLLIQAFAAEKSDFSQLPIVPIRSLASKYLTMARRGTNELMLRRALWWGYTIKGAAKYRRGRDEGNTLYFFPPAGYFTPIRNNGIGQHPSSLFGASKDANIVIALRDRWPNAIPHVERAGAIMGNVSSDIRRNVAKSIMAGNVKPVGAFDAGLAFFKSIMIPQRAQASMELNGKYRHIQDLSYLNMPNRLLETSMMEDPSVRLLEKRDQEFTGRNMEKADIEGKKTASDRDWETIWHI